ncbi:MAG: zinc-dependent metalloprotease family protein [Candidatus Eisenbacteria bacterium]
MAKDFVALFADSDAGGCGIAFCLPSGAPEGFAQVVDWTPCVEIPGFAHEIGHLQGCAHNKEDAGSGCNNNCYSFATASTASSAGGR